MTNNCFTTVQVFNSWVITLVGIVRKHKRFLPINVQPNNEFTYSRDTTVYSYVPKKSKAVILLSSMRMSGEVVGSQVALKSRTLRWLFFIT